MNRPTNVRTIVQARDVSGRPLPSDVDAEAGLLGSAIFVEGVLAEARGLVNVHTFYDPSHERVWRVLEELDDAGKPVDQLSVLAGLRSHDWANSLALGGRGESIGAISFLEHLRAFSADHAHAIGWAKHLATLAVNRRVTEAAQKIHGEGCAGTANRPDAFAGWAMETMTRATEAPRTSSMRSIGEVARERRLVHAEQWAGKREPWGLALPQSRLNAILHGLSMGEVSFVAALESGGKSALAQQVGLYLAGMTSKDERRLYQGQPIGVAYLTLEMPKEQITDRALCHIAEISWRKLQTGADLVDDGITETSEPISPDEHGRLNDAHKLLDDMPFEIDDGDQDITRIRAAARRAQSRLRARGARLRLLIVDHIHILDLAGEENSTRALSDAARGLKRIAVEFGIHVMCLAQFTQDAARREGAPHNGDIKDASAIKQIADKIILLHRPWSKLTNKDSDEAARIVDHAEVHITKNRNGPLGVVPMRIVGKHFAFREVQRADVPETPQKPKRTRTRPGPYDRKPDVPPPPNAVNA